MTTSFQRRVERLETAFGGRGRCEERLRLLALRMDEDAESVIEAVGHEEAALGQLIDSEGRTTWEGFCRLRDLMAEAAEKLPTPQSPMPNRPGSPPKMGDKPFPAGHQEGK